MWVTTRGEMGMPGRRDVQVPSVTPGCAMSPPSPKYSLPPLEPSLPKNHLKTRLQSMDCSGNGNPAWNYPEERNETPETIAAIPPL